MKPENASYSILIVDDTPANLTLLVDVLTAAGFGVRVARSGEMALKRVAYDPPSLILLDVVMPGEDGFAICRRLKADPAVSHIPVIFMTALASASDKVKGFEAGAVDYVTKPLQPEEVLARIVTHLRLHDLTMGLQEQNQLLEKRSQLERARLLEAVNQQKDQLQRLHAKLTEVGEQERKELARELHDVLGQSLTAIRMNLAAVEQELAPLATPFVRERLAEAAALTDQTLEQIRELSLDLRPSMLDDLGLAPTLRWHLARYARRVNVKASLKVDGMEERLPAPVETTAYRVVQEALTNVARHAQASQVTVELRRQGDDLAVVVVDDGRGFDVNQVLAASDGVRGLGLLGMQERVSLAGGVLEIESEPGQGAAIRFTLPGGKREDACVRSLRASAS